MIIIFLSLGISTIYSQSDFIKRFFPEENLENHYIIKQWTTSEGLPQNSINSIAQTADGYIWLATQGGLVRFDGFQFALFDLNKFPTVGTNRIMKLSADEKGGLWVLGEGGNVSYYYMNKFKSYTLQIFNLLGEGAFLLNEVFVEDNNSLWLASNFNIIRFDGTKFTKVTNNSKGIILRFRFFKNNDGSLFVINYFGIYKLVGNKLNNLKYFAGTRCNAIAFGKDSTFYVGTDKGLYNNTNLKTKVKIGSKLFPSNQGIDYIMSDFENNLWLSLENDGLWFFKNGIARELKSPIFNKSQINIIFEDNQKNIWIGTKTYGLIQLKKRLLYSISLKTSQFNDIIYPILKMKDNSIWVGSNGSGIAKITSNRIDYYNYKKQQLDDEIWSILQSRTGDIYVGSLYSGVQKYNNNVFAKIPELKDLSQNSVFAIYEDINNGLWFGTDIGVFHYFNKTLKHFSISNSNLPGNRISSIVEDDEGVLWFATDKGLGYYKNGMFKSITFGKGRSTNYIRSIFIDNQNRKWLGTYGGGLVYYYKGKSKVITTKNGLYNNFIHSVIEDKFGNFWMPTNNGIFRVIKKEILNFIEDDKQMLTSFVYLQSNNLTSNEFNGGMQPSYAQLEDGTILLSTLEGIVAMDLSNFKVDSIIPKVYIENFIVDGEKYSLDSTITIQSDYSEIMINFTALDLKNPENLLFKYMIEGLDDNWSTLNNDRSANYKHIPHGSYRFKVVAKNADGGWNKVGATIEFEIEATLFETLWFKLLIFLFVIFSIASYFGIRFKLQKKRALQLEKTVKDRTKSLSIALEKSRIAQNNESFHRNIAENLNSDKTELLRIVSHNLKNPIGVIRNSSEFITDDLTDSETILEMSKIIKDSATHMLQSITQLLQSSEVEDSHFKLNRVEFNLIEAIEKVLSDNKILAVRKKQKIFFNAKSQSLIIKADYNCILICVDNFVGNAIKYSPSKKNIVIEIIEDTSKIIFKVTDEGPGLSKSDLEIAFGKFKKLSARPTANESSTGLGLSIVKKIIELHDGEVGINSTLGEGSTFYFTLPI